MDTRFSPALAGSRVSSGSTGGSASSGLNATAAATRAIPEALAEQQAIVEQLEREFTVLLDRLQPAMISYPCGAVSDTKDPESSVPVVRQVQATNRRLAAMIDLVRNTHQHCQL